MSSCSLTADKNAAPDFSPGMQEVPYTGPVMFEKN